MNTLKETKEEIKAAFDSGLAQIELIHDKIIKVDHCINGLRNELTSLQEELKSQKEKLLEFVDSLPEPGDNEGYFNTDKLSYKSPLQSDWPYIATNINSHE